MQVQQRESGNSEIAREKRKESMAHSYKNKSVLVITALMAFTMVAEVAATAVVETGRRGCRSGGGSGNASSI